MRLKKFSKKYVSTKRKKLLRYKGHPFIVPAMTLMALIVVSLVVYFRLGGQTFNAADTRVVIVSYDKKKQTVPTYAPDVGALLKRLNIKLNDGDVVEPAVDTAIVEDNFRINVYRARPVTIIDGSKKTFALSAATTARSIAKQAGIEVYPEDGVTKELPANVLRYGSIGEEVVIDRATPTFLNLYGTPVALRTRANTVGELLKEKNVKLAASDTVQPSVDTILTPNTQVFVVRIGTQLITVEEPIVPPTQTIEDASLSFGTTAVRQQGVPGKKLITYQIDLQNGKETGRRVIQEVIAQAAVEQIVARGKAVSIPEDKTSVMAAAGIAPSDYPYVNYIVSRESGWCPTKLQGQIGYCPAYAPSSIPSNLGYGLGQATPGTKMAPFGADWQTSAVTQLRWATSYAAGRFGSWAAAYNYWQVNHNW